MATIRKTFSVDASLAFRLRDKAAEEDRTESAVLNRLLRNAMEATVPHPAKTTSKKKGAVKA